LHGVSNVFLFRRLQRLFASIFLAFLAPLEFEFLINIIRVLRVLLEMGKNIINEFSVSKRGL